MFNWWLILLLVVLTCTFIGLAVYLVWYFASPEEGGVAILGRLLFGLSLVLSLGGVLLLPYDVADAPDPTESHRYVKTLNTPLMWHFFFWMLIVLGWTICPFAMFFYAFWDPERAGGGRRALLQSSIASLATVALLALILGVCFAKVGVAEVPFQLYAGSGQIEPFPVLPPGGGGEARRMELHVGFTAYAVGLFSLMGWFWVLFYVAPGFCAYPIVAFSAFRHRLRRLSAAGFAERMYVILAKAETLLEIAKELREETRGRVRVASHKKVQILRNEVYLLETEQEYLTWAYTQAGGSPFIVYGKLLLALLALAVVILWTLHFPIWYIARATVFLNGILIALDHAFGLLAILFYAVLMFYFYCAAFQGQLMLGLTWMVGLFPIYPFHAHDTLVHTFVFHAFAMASITPTLLTLAAMAFEPYAANSTIAGMTNAYVRHLRGIGAFLRWVPLVFLVIVALIGIATILAERKKQKRKSRANRAATSAK